MDASFFQKINSFYDTKNLNLELLREICVTQTYKSGTILSKSKIHNNKAGFIQKGIVKYFQYGRQDGEIIFMFRKDPSFIAYSASGFFLNQPSQIFCQAITDVTIYEMESEKLFELADRNPTFYRGLIRMITHIYVDIETKEHDILEKTSTERYIEFAAKHPDILARVPLRSVASYLNIQPGSLSRIRNQLKLSS